MKALLLDDRPKVEPPWSPVRGSGLWPRRVVETGLSGYSMRWCPAIAELSG